MNTITRKSATLFEFNDEISCRRFAKKLEGILDFGLLSLRDIETEARSFAGYGYKSEAKDSSWKEYVHDISSDDIVVHVWSNDYATLSIKKEEPKKVLTMDDFRDDLRKAMAGLFDKYKDSDVLKRLDEAMITIKIEDGKYVGGKIYKGVE